MRPARWLAALAAAAVAATLLLAPATAATAAQCIDDEPTGITGKNVVLVAHGYRGEQLNDTVRGLTAALDPAKWAVYAFNYVDTNTQWPDKSDAAACLRQVITADHAATGSSAGNVYIVAHSMGGILARFALNPAAAADVDKMVAGVVTLDTPSHGSPVAGTALAQFLQFKSGDAAKCLSLHHPGSLPAGCAYAPYLPAGVPLAQIAGDVTISRNFFAFGYSGLNTNSDGLVWTNSQTGYATSADGTPPPAKITSQTVTCETGAWNLLPTLASIGADSFMNRADPFGFIWSKLIASGSPVINGDAGALALVAAISSHTTCGHGNMPKNADAIARAAAALNAMPNRSPAWVIDGTGVGPAKLNASPSSVDAGPTVTNEGNGPVCGALHANTGWAVTYSRGGGDTIGAVALWWYAHDGDYPPDIPRTATGITLGSTEQAFHTAYPNAHQSTEPWDHALGDPTYADWVVDLNGPVAFSIHDGVIDSIFVGLDGIPSEMCE